MQIIDSRQGIEMTDFEGAFTDLWAVAYRVAYRILGDRAEAEDVAQDALVRVAERWRVVAPGAAAFTAHVAGQRAIDLWRRRQNQRMPYPSRPGHDPEDHLVDRDELVAALRRLPTRQRHVVVLRYLADMSEQDTAAALRCSPGSVKQHASRGLASLRISLGPALDED